MIDSDYYIINRKPQRFREMRIAGRTAIFLNSDGKVLDYGVPVRFSPQNKKLNRYAEAVAEKLSLGIKLRITDAVNDADMIKCPECGMLNPSGSMYCLDCGAEI